MPRVSVVMPVYNGAKYLGESIESVQAQTFDDWELLAVNEYGSEDGSDRIIQRYARKDPRIKLIQNESKLGLAESLNRGIHLAQGEYIARLDAGDLAVPERFEKQVELLDKLPNIGVCGSYQHHFGPGVDWIHMPPVTPEKCRARFLFNCDICHSTLMIRKEVMEKNNLYYDKNFLAEDFELWTRMIKYTDFTNIPEVLGEYRWDGDNITISKLEKLDEESGYIVAKQIENNLQIKIKDEESTFFRGWNNPFDNANSAREKEEMLNRFQEILTEIWKKNKIIGFYEEQSLLYTIRSKWRWAKYNAPWDAQDESEIMCIEQIFDENFKPPFHLKWKRFLKNNPTMKMKVKKVIKKGLRPFVRISRNIMLKLSAEVIKVLTQHINDITWDRFERLESRIGICEGCLLESEKRIGGTLKNCIEVCKTDLLKEQEIRSVETEKRVFAAIENQIETCENRFLRHQESQIEKIEDNILDIINRKMEESEKTILETQETRIGKTEDNILDTISRKIEESEKTIIETHDSRIWKAEKNTIATQDGRIWKAERAISNEVRGDIFNLRFLVEKSLNQVEKKRNDISNRTYNTLFYEDNRYLSVISASEVLKNILPKLAVESMVDFGCGTGTWLSVAQEYGVTKILGIDGDYVPRDMLMIAEDNFMPQNLEDKVQLEGNFDLAISLEVAEHLEAEYADNLIDSLCSSSKIILFSAAHPGQGGDHHVNEQPFNYWENKFLERGYELIEIRPLFSDNHKIASWYQQNIGLYVHKSIYNEIRAKF